MEAILLDELHKDINNKEFVVRCNILARRIAAAGMTLEVNSATADVVSGSVDPTVIYVSEYTTINDLEYAVNTRITGFTFGAPHYVKSLLDQLKDNNDGKLSTRIPVQS